MAEDHKRYNSFQCYVGLRVARFPHAIIRRATSLYLAVGLLCNVFYIFDVANICARVASALSLLLTLVIYRSNVQTTLPDAPTRTRLGNYTFQACTIAALNTVLLVIPYVVLTIGGGYPLGTSVKDIEDVRHDDKIYSAAIATNYTLMVASGFAMAIIGIHFIVSSHRLWDSMYKQRIRKFDEGDDIATFCFMADPNTVDGLEYLLQPGPRGLMPKQQIY